MGFFNEVEFASEKIIEIDQLLIAVDRLVGLLLKGETDVQAKAMLATSSALRRTHNAVTATSDDHVVFRNHLAREFFSHGILGLTRRRSS